MGKQLQLGLKTLSSKPSTKPNKTKPSSHLTVSSTLFIYLKYSRNSLYLLCLCTLVTVNCFFSFFLVLSLSILTPLSHRFLLLFFLVYSIACVCLIEILCHFLFNSLFCLIGLRFWEPSLPTCQCALYCHLYLCYFLSSIFHLNIWVCLVFTDGSLNVQNFLFVQYTGRLQ